MQKATRYSNNYRVSDNWFNNPINTLLVILGSGDESFSHLCGGYSYDLTALRPLLYGLCSGLLHCDVNK